MKSSASTLFLLFQLFPIFMGIISIVLRQRRDHIWRMSLHTSLLMLSLALSIVPTVCLAWAAEPVGSWQFTDITGKLHPGALKYYDEKGIAVPDALR